MPSPEAIAAALEAAERSGLSYVSLREKWARKGWKKVSGQWVRTGRKDHREVRRSRILARQVVAEAARVGGLVAVFFPKNE